MTRSSPLISTTALAARLGQADLRIIDASWHLDGRDGRIDFEAARIPGAVFFDLEAGSDQHSPLPHTLPPPNAFSAHMSRLGVSEHDDIVVYDTLGLVSSARVWWMLRIMGAQRVRVLDGGMPKWRAENLPLESGLRQKPAAAVYRARFQSKGLAMLGDVRSALSRNKQVIDARSRARFRGEAPEPRAGLRSGHMPGAANLPFADILNADSTMKRGADLAAAFADAGVDPQRPVITSCGSGVTAAILSLGLAELGVKLGAQSRLYDASWAEWGGRDDTAVVTG